MLTLDLIKLIYSRYSLANLLKQFVTENLLNRLILLYIPDAYSLVNLLRHTV